MRWPRPLRRRGRAAANAEADQDVLERQRARMVAEQLEARGIEDPEILEAFRAVPRHAFVEGDEPYGDHAMPVGSGQTISQPYVVARMTELLATRPGDRILEIGTGSGYQAAILATLGCRVTSIERHADLADQARRRLAALAPADSVEVRVGDGTLGAPDGAPWDGIIVTAAAPAVPHSLREQLADGARLVIPVGSRLRQELVVVTRRGNEWTERFDGPVIFVPLIGDEGFEG
jgi:protein-L-isoaspartate(D-aspartate) O-methyltransferase